MTKPWWSVIWMPRSQVRSSVGAAWPPPPPGPPGPPGPSVPPGGAVGVPEGGGPGGVPPPPLPVWV
ncbi:hypothetical protein FRZ03_15315 [Streptomyces misionensis]|uniref:Uncharacterized protein n=1 Tax=Streptomyces misionensis TaxID=67331 RepID=A0A5C6JTA1_9ACTN|nr:hypothetical protein FRZ03_15315 [Streptomyces misionensis]